MTALPPTQVQAVVLDQQHDLDCPLSDILGARLATSRLPTEQLARRQDPIAGRYHSQPGRFHDDTASWSIPAISSINRQPDPADANSGVASSTRS